MRYTAKFLVTGGFVAIYFFNRVQSYIISFIKGYRLCSLDLNGNDGESPRYDVLKPPLKNMFIFGLGYVGSSFAQHLVKKGWTVSGTCTSSTEVKRLQDMNIDAFLFSTRAKYISRMKSSSHMLITIPPVEGHESELVLDLFTEHLLESWGWGALQWVGYLSSTGVYGECNGAWVTEESPLRPCNAKTQARATAEQQWKALFEQHGLPVHIFRLAGIYGPGRSALHTARNTLDSLVQRGDFCNAAVSDGAGAEKALSAASINPSCNNTRMRGAAVVAEAEDAYVSRIHVADIVQCLEASIAHPAGGGSVYNVADDRPSSRREVRIHYWLCTHLDYHLLLSSR